MEILILGIDPGSVITGYGFLAGDGIGPPRHLAAGTIKTDRNSHLAQRLLTVFDSLSELIAQHRPDEVAVEEVFQAKNARSALALGHARGAALLAAAKAGRPVFAYSPARIKQAVTGSGRAGKAQVAKVVAMLLGLGQPPPADAADALAVALCHLHSRGRKGAGP
jgi:crossover junction endodeoxyribonuclease RuvC